MRLKDIQDGAEFAAGAIDALNITGVAKNRPKKGRASKQLQILIPSGGV